MAFLLISGSGANRASDRVAAIVTAAMRYPSDRGLSYTTFAYRNLQSPGQVRSGIKVKVTVEIEKAGKISGDDVAQRHRKSRSTYSGPRRFY